MRTPGQTDEAVRTPGQTDDVPNSTQKTATASCWTIPLFSILIHDKVQLLRRYWNWIWEGLSILRLIFPISAKLDNLTDHPWSFFMNFLANYIVQCAMRHEVHSLVCNAS